MELVSFPLPFRSFILSLLTTDNFSRDIHKCVVRQQP